MTIGLPPEPVHEAVAPTGGETRGLSQSQIVRKRFLRHRGAVVALTVLTALVVLVTTSIGWGPIPGWWLWGYEQIPPATAGGVPTAGLPTWLGGSGFAIGEHPFGQDEVGRDNFARTMRGAQQSLTVMVIAGLLACGIGIVVGALAGYFRGRADAVLMRFTDGMLTIPVIVVGAVLGRRFGSLGAIALAVVIGIVLWTGLARLVRGEFLSLREREFVDAARVAGARSGRIIFRHILPNAVGVIIVNTTLLMSSAILIETALSFLGFGIKPPDISLGALISENQSAFNTRPWLFWWPGLCIVVIALCINFIGDGLRDAFDPRGRRVPSRRQVAQRQSTGAGTGDVRNEVAG